MLALKWRVTRLLSSSVTGGFGFLQTTSCGSKGGETCDAGWHLTQTIRSARDTLVTTRWMAAKDKSYNELRGWIG